LSDPFETALSKVVAGRRKSERLFAQARRERELEDQAKQALKMEAFDELKARIAAKDEAIRSMGFSRDEVIDPRRNFYRLLLNCENKAIAVDLARFRHGYYMYVWWEHLRNSDGGIDPLETANPGTLDEVMATLGSWVGSHGKLPATGPEGSVE
jgi:hypothetical protein